ncbi:co-chaperone GroES [Luteibaculum oceani]|nr:co-chaperone GroES family protein [Luteibaculum oceani]
MGEIDVMDATQLNKLIIVGDRVLIKPLKPVEKTDSGLFLPPGVQQKDKIARGYVINVGPGYPIPALQEVDQPWKESAEEVKYVPLQPKKGDLAVYLQKSAYDIEFNGEKFIIIPHSAILLLYRDDD